MIFVMALTFISIVAMGSYVMGRDHGREQTLAMIKKQKSEVEVFLQTLTKPQGQQDKKKKPTLNVNRFVGDKRVSH